MKRCSCLRYKELIANRNESKLWIWNGNLVPLYFKYPLVEFEGDKVIEICPYYLYYRNNDRISDGFFRDLSDREENMILEAVKNCKELVPLDAERYINDREAEILDKFSEKREWELDENLFNYFVDFLEKKEDREIKINFDVCNNLPVASEERKKCIDQCWLDAFEKYLIERI